MTTRNTETPTRRHILTAGLSGAALLVLGCGDRGRPNGRRISSASDHPQFPPPRPTAGPSHASPSVARPRTYCTATEANIEGPFFKPSAPERSTLGPAGAKGVALRLAGCVRSSRCEPLAGAHIEVWQADHLGAYDHHGFDFRGRLATGEGGRWELSSVVPGHYLNGASYRPAHVHVKVHARGHRSLTTQLYFEGDPYNEHDPFIRESLIMKLTRSAGVVSASYDFVLEPS